MNDREPESIEPESNQDETLVAYLDGELPRQERSDLEQCLINDEALRFRLQSLQRGWELLSWLPSPVVNERSVQSTLELVINDVRKRSHSSASKTSRSTDSVSTRTPSVDHRGRSIWHVAVLVGLLTMGIVMVGKRWIDRRNDAMDVADFPVAIDMDAYSIAADTDLIDDLMASSRWRVVVGESGLPEIESLTQPGIPTSIRTKDELIDRLADIPAEQRLTALSRWERFEQLDGPRKEKLREAADQVLGRADAARRLETIRSYARWREQLSEVAIRAIENSTGGDRNDALEVAIAETITSIGRVTGRNLSDEAIERIDFTLIQIAKARIDQEKNKNGQSERTQPNQRLSRVMKQRGPFGNDPQAIYRMFAARIVFRGSDRGTEGEIPPLDVSELELIQSMLPAKDLETLQRYVNDPWMRSFIIEDWAQEAIRRKSRRQTKPPTLSEKYEALPADQKEMVDLMPPEKSRRWLLEFAR